MAKNRISSLINWWPLASIGLIFCILPGCSASIKKPSPDEITINHSDKYQIIEGFGASGGWWAQDVGGWEGEKRNLVIQLLFDKKKGIGLTIYRYNIGAGAGDYIQDRWRRAETFEVSKGVYDWNRDANAVWVLKAASLAGADNIIAFSNSPTGRMTVSGVPVGEVDGRSNLRPEMVDEYTQYLVDVVRHLIEDEHVPVSWISPVNEPQLDWKFGNGQEGCHYNPDEVLLVTRSLINAINSSGLDVKVSVFESGEWKNSQEYFDRLLDDKEVASQLDHIAVHSYWSESIDKRALVQFLQDKYPQTHLWMSEWTEMKSGIDLGMESALVLANTIHDDLTLGGVTSWQYWIAVSKYSFHDGLIYVDQTKQTITETKRLWTLGNYSRFIHPGFARIGSTTGADDLKVSSYQSPDQSQIIVVVINNSKSAARKTIKGIPAALKHMSAYTTSAGDDLKEVYSGQAVDYYTFPEESVTTFVYTQK